MLELLRQSLGPMQCFSKEFAMSGEGRCTFYKMFCLTSSPHRRFHSAKSRRFLGMTKTNLGPSLVAQ